MDDMILQIADRIEKIVKENELHPFGGLQRRRAHYFDKKFDDHKLFNTLKSIVEDGYTYHYGGREELQFNFGFDKIRGQKIFRYGVAFSLQASQSLPDPVEVLGPQIERYNSFIQEYADQYKSYSYWVYEKNNSESTYHENLDVIPEHFVENGNFIFIGKYIEKDNLELNQNELYEIISTFDDLMYLYEAVVLDNYFKKADERIIRLAWNTNNWEKPSGREGKSSNKNTHEGKYGFGFEEWLFDKSKLVDGYVYGFVQPFHSDDKDTYKLTTRDLKLYTRNKEEKFWIGDIKGVQVISAELANYAYQIYEKNGWIEDRKRDLRHLGIEPTLIDSANQFIEKATYMFNVRYKPPQIEELSDELKSMSDEEFRAINTDRYTAVKVKEVLKKKESFAISSGDGSFTTKDFKSIIKGSTRVTTSEHRNVHDEIQITFSEWLNANLNPDELYVEHKTDDGRKLDIYMVDNGVKRIFEVKSYNSLKTSLKVGLGQLINYRYFPNLNQSDEIYLVSYLKPNESEIEYIKHLNSELNLNFGYIQFDVAKNQLIKQVGIELI